MSKKQQIIIGTAALVLAGVFIFSDFDWLYPKEKKKGNGVAKATGGADPFMMLEVDEKEFPNASGKCGKVTLNDLSAKK